MGTDSFKFDRGELRVAGGDYDEITLAGNSAEAIAALQSVVNSNRRSGGRVSIVSVEFECDDTPDLFEDRHAGREGTPERGVGPDDTQEQGGVEGGTGERPAPRTE